MIKLIKAFRRDENTVCAMYFDTDRSQDFIVEWSNVHPKTGEVGDYDLQLNCLSNSEILNEIVIEAISEGESDDNKQLDLYLAIRDTFDRMDCEDCE